MNALPEEWYSAIDKQNDNLWVLLDGAMQPSIAEKLADHPVGVRSFFEEHSKAAQALGPWLISAECAAALGIDGCAQGVNWIATELPFEEVFDHLRLWMHDSYPQPRVWLRLADARVLLAMSSVWISVHWDSFCYPWRAWCYADRDGIGRMWEMGRKNEHVVPFARLAAEQQHALDLACLPDQMLHELKRLVTPHPTLKGQREQLHVVAKAILGQARTAGYEAEEDLRQLLIWALRKGVNAPRLMLKLLAIEQLLLGEELALALEQDLDIDEGGS